MKKIIGIKRNSAKIYTYYTQAAIYAGLQSVNLCIPYTLDCTWGNH